MLYSMLYNRFYFFNNTRSISFYTSFPKESFNSLLYLIQYITIIHAVTEPILIYYALSFSERDLFLRAFRRGRNKSEAAVNWGKTITMGEKGRWKKKRMFWHFRSLRTTVGYVFSKLEMTCFFSFYPAKWSIYSRVPVGRYPSTQFISFI